MRLYIAPDTESAVRKTADIIEQFLNSATPTGASARLGPRSVLGVATGTTMQEPLAEVVRRYQQAGLSLACATVYLLDEYIGLATDDPRTFANTVNRLLTQRTDLAADAVHGPNPYSADLHAACDEYEQQVRSAHVGLQLLGIGTNGHIAFNEPGSKFTSTTRVVHLSEQTRADNAGAFMSGTPMPVSAITQGIATILAADELLLVACGRHKARAVASAIEGPVGEAVPASALRLHQNATVICDPAAASLLSDSVLCSSFTPEVPRRAAS